MMGGNVECELQRYEIVGTNDIGQSVRAWHTYVKLTGWLDLMSQITNMNTGSGTFSTKMEQSTHMFVADYVKIDDEVRDVQFVDHRGRIYEVLIIDNPMELNRQLELYLRYVGDGDGR